MQPGNMPQRTRAGLPARPARRRVHTGEDADERNADLHGGKKTVRALRPTSKAVFSRFVALLDIDF